MIAERDDVVAIADDATCSGAFALFSAFERRYASPDSIVGSLGVYRRLENHSQILKDIGLDIRYISRGEGKVDGAPDIPYTDRFLKEVDESVDNIYQDFLSLISDNLDINKETLVKNGARCYSNEEAIEHNYITEIMTYRELHFKMKDDKDKVSRTDAVTAIAQVAGIDDPVLVNGYIASDMSITDIAIDAKKRADKAQVERVDVSSGSINTAGAGQVTEVDPWTDVKFMGDE